MSRSRALELRFDLSRTPLDAAEQALFAEDLRRLGLAPTLWDVLNATASASTPTAVPWWLRSYREGELVGALLLLTYCHPGKALFRRTLLSRTLDAPRVQQFFWNRMGAGIDQYSNPGFVRAGLERSAFVHAALRFLLPKYLLGCLISPPQAATPYPASVTPHFDYGVIDLRTAGDETYFLRAHANLGRKGRKFRNKGGSLEVTEGPLPPDDVARIGGWLRELEPEARLPFQELYPHMARGALACAGTVHVLARLGGQLVGYQSFLRSGDRLSCLSGVFDRTRSSTYHAYENILLESVRYAAQRGVSYIDCGPVVNPTKRGLMTHFVRSELRYYSRFLPVRRSVGWLLDRSALSPRKFGPYIGQEPVWRPASGL